MTASTQPVAESLRPGVAVVPHLWELGVIAHDAWPPPVEPGGETEAERLLRSHPASATALARLAREQLSLGAVADAVATARRVAHDGGFTDDAALLVAMQTLLLAGERAFAADLLTDWKAAAAATSRTLPSLAMISEAEMLASRGESEAALAVLDMGGRSVSKVASARAALLIAAQKYDAGLRELRSAMSQGPPNPVDYINYGYVFAVRGAWAKAIHATQVAVHIAPVDVTANLNLVNYYLACNDWAAAARLTQLLARRYPLDGRVVCAQAAVHVQAGRQSKALSVLREALSATSADRDRDADRAEWQAMAEVLRWRMGRLGERAVRDSLLRIVRSVAPIRPSVVAMLACLSNDIDDLPTLRDVKRLVQSGQSEASLHAIDVQIAILSGALDDALVTSRAWLETEVFNNLAAVSTTYLTCMVQGDLSESVRIGERALRRMPNEPVLRNNIAFAKVLLGDVRGAERVLEGHRAPITICTEALIRLAKADMQGAERLYRQAERSASDRLQTELVHLYRAIGYYWFDFGEQPDFDEVPRELHRDLRIRLLRHAWDAWIRERRPLN